MIFIAFLLLTILVSHTGIAYVGILLTPGNMLDWLPKHIQTIKNPYLQDLLTCSKCISGQFALWTFVALSFHYQTFNPILSPMLCIAWISWVIVVTDQLMKRYGYA